ncbi:multidrug efflux SMR transporter [candidate division KSB1 bacterium]|nr:multidrug efflux SMR transporter [candidate division KSB1 bacterium]
MAWFYLLIAGLCEMGWALGLKMSQESGARMLWIGSAIISMALSGLFLWLAQKSIPMGTAYAVWTGIGTVGTFITGIILFDDSADLWRVMSATLIVIGMVGLKLAHN